MRDFPMVHGGIEPEMVLGKTVVDGRGTALGAVEDVGITDRRRVKFLVVGSGRSFIRVEASDVDGIDEQSVTVRRLA